MGVVDTSSTGTPTLFLPQEPDPVGARIDPPGAKACDMSAGTVAGRDWVEGGGTLALP